MKRPLVQILVVVANIQMRTLKRKVPCEQQLDMGESLLRDRAIPCEFFQFTESLSKGKQVNIPAPGRGYCVATQPNSETPAWSPRRVIFSF